MSRDAASAMPTRAAVVAAQLRELIQSGELPPGERLRQIEIAERFGVSTTPVREAFVTLAREGLVRQDAHRGVVVFAPTIKELEELYDIRIALEPLATKQAAERMTEQHLAELDVLVTELADVVGTSAYMGVNHRFHSFIYSVAERPRLAEIIDQLREASSSYLALTVRWNDPKYSRSAHAEHVEIARLLHEGTPSQTAREMRRHLESNEQQVIRLIREGKGLSDAEGL